MSVSVYAHNGLLYFYPSPDLFNDETRFIPTDDRSHIGCVVMDSKKDLRVSREAIELMKQIEVGSDSIGDIDWWACDDGTHAFSWFGAIYRVIDPKTAQSARGFKPHAGLPCTLIPNDVPPEIVEAKLVLDEEEPYEGGDDSPYMWKEPFRIEKAKA